MRSVWRIGDRVMGKVVRDSHFKPGASLRFDPGSGPFRPCAWRASKRAKAVSAEGLRWSFIILQRNVRRSCVGNDRDLYNGGGGTD